MAYLLIERGVVCYREGGLSTFFYIFQKVQYRRIPAMKTKADRPRVIELIRQQGQQKVVLRKKGVPHRVFDWERCLVGLAGSVLSPGKFLLVKRCYVVDIF